MGSMIDFLEYIERTNAATTAEAIFTHSSMRWPSSGLIWCCSAS